MMVNLSIFRRVCLLANYHHHMILILLRRRRHHHHQQQQQQQSSHVRWCTSLTACSAWSFGRVMDCTTLGTLNGSPFAFFLTSSVIGDPRIARRYIIFSCWSHIQEKVGFDHCEDKCVDRVLSDGNAHMNFCSHDRLLQKSVSGAPAAFHANMVM
jgi:hypothetical protein